MAIVNRTNDSFWSGNRHGDLASARRALDAAVELGADIVDVGGVRAGQEGEVVTPEQEIERVVPFLARAREDHPDLVLSLDTWRSEVARVAAAEAGLDLVNDTWAGHDRDLVHVAARCRRRLRHLAHRGPAAAHRPGRRHLPARAARRARRRAAHPARGRRARGGGRHPGRPGARRPDPRLRQDHRALADPAAAHRGDRGAWATPCCRRCPARTSSARPSTCPPTTGSRARWRPPRSPPGSGPRSSGRTTCGPPGGSSTWWRRSGVTRAAAASRCRGVGEVSARHPARWPASGSSSSAASGRRRSPG